MPATMGAMPVTETMAAVIRVPVACEAVSSAACADRCVVASVAELPAVAVAQPLAAMPAVPLKAASNLPALKD